MPPSVVVTRYCTCYWHELWRVIRNTRSPVAVLTFTIARLLGSNRVWTFRAGRCRGWQKSCGCLTHWLSDVTFEYECPECNDQFWHDYGIAMARQLSNKV